MKIRFGAIFLSALALYASVSVSQAAPVKVSVAAEPSPPLAAKNAAGDWEGFDVDVAKAVCRAAKLDCQIVATAWDGIIPALQTKKIDVIWASMTITPEREKQIAFTIPYYHAPTEFVGNKEDKFDFAPGGLKGKTIGVEAATSYVSYLQRAHPEATVKTYNSIDSATSDLSVGRLDLVISDRLMLDDFLATSAGACCSGKAFPADKILDSGVGGGIRKEDADLKARLDDGIRQIYRDGEFQKIEKRYFSYDLGTPPSQ